jgi:hypothetical protein
MLVHDETIKDIEAKIEQTQRLLDEAQKWVNLLGTARNNLAVLKRAKALLESDEVTPEPSEYVHVDEPQVQVVIAEPHTTRLTESSERSSIGASILAVLTEAGSPLPVQTILARVRDKGRSDITLKTLGGVLSQYLTKGAVRRTDRATYALPLANGNGVAMQNN